MAPTSEGMTEADVTFYVKTVSQNLPWEDRARRILATHAALVELKIEQAKLIVYADDCNRRMESARTALAEAQADSARWQAAVEAAKPRPAILPDLDLGYYAATCDVCGAPQTGEEAEEPLCDKCWNERASRQPDPAPTGE